MANDIGNAVLAGDKSGNWWMLHATGSMEGGSSLTLSPTGSPGSNPITLNGSTQWFESSGVAFPAGDFSIITVINFSSLPAFFDILAAWTGSSATQKFVLEGDSGGNVSFYVNDAGGTAHSISKAGLTTGSYMVLAATFTVATGAVKIRLNGSNATGSVTASIKAATTPHSFGARSGGSIFTAGSSYGAFFTEKVLSDADIDRIGAMAVPGVTSWLKLNGIETSALASAPDNVNGTRREIGERAPASDGTTRLTVQTLKRDVSFKTVALTVGDAFTWESFIRGEGHVWQFEDFGLYSSKGSVPQDTTGCSIVAGSAKFGTHKLRIASGQFQTDTDALTNMAGYFGDYTVMFWKSTDSGATWHHYVLRSDGVKWLDGATTGASFAAFLSIGGSGDVTLQSNADFDDFVCLPFKVLDTWPALFYARSASYPNTPFIEASGAMVPEQATRLVAGDATDVVFKSASSKTNVRLNITLTAR